MLTTDLQPIWTDTHAHLDAPEIAALVGGATQVRRAAQAAGVGLCVWPAVHPSHFDAVREQARAHGDGYALGLHPLWVPQATEADVATLDAALTCHRADPHLVALGEIGLDFFVPALCTPAMRERQQWFYRAQLKLAKKHRLPVLLHVRRSADVLLKHLREVWAGAPPAGLAGIAHAFNGSDAQAAAFIALGFKLGFGGAVTFDGARQLRHLAATLPDSALVLETDTPDIPPQWLYATAAQRASGQRQGVNTPAELPRIGAVVAELRGTTPADLAHLTTRNAYQALPRLALLANAAHASAANGCP